ncbi:MAG: peptidoglycan D,D-transpeptidase FtsI family protein [Acidimicrobiia bacterium]
MNRPIRRVGYAMTVLILILVAQLTYLQVVDANKLANDPRNSRRAESEYNRARGSIQTADGTLVATSLPTKGDFKYLRVYPQGELFAQVSGYQSFVDLVGKSGVESSYNQVLTGRDTSLQLKNIGDLLTGKAATNNVVLSLTDAAQRAAQDALGSQKGSVVALDVKTGAVLAMYSNPTYDPNGLAVHDSQVVQTNYNAITSPLNDEPAKARAYTLRYPPGSTFKVVTTKSALETGLVTPDNPVFPDSDGFDIPGTEAKLRNFGGKTCGGNVLESFVNSCNATFAALGYQLNDQFPPQMEMCGLNRQPPIDLDPAAVPSVGPQVGADRPRFALAGIGQGDVFTSPLQMALIAAGIANGGVIMQPHVVQEITNADGATVRTIDSKPWTTCMTPQTAAALTGMMVDVVQRGTGTAAQIDGVTVAGKTGTAQTADGESPHAWFIAFAPAEAPRYAVAVIVEHGGDYGSEATGGAVAAPIAKHVLQALLATR